MLAPQPSGVSQQPLQPPPQPTQGGDQPLPPAVNIDPSEHGVYADWDDMFFSLKSIIPDDILMI